MTEKIKELKLLSLINENDKYIIPLYQRAYSWSEKEIEQLIDDIYDYSDNEYYLGSLIVNKQNDLYEVIDGQQRLTTLFLLFKVLGYNIYNKITFECRDKSNYTLSNLNNVEVDSDRLERNIIIGKDIIEQKLRCKSINVNKLKEKLKSVIIYRIEVPEHTDLNKYFEIMNTRGEQLEQCDVLKAQLMSYLKTPEDREIFSMVWNACSDMTGYIQMHFKRNLRDIIFGNNWDEMVDNIFSKEKIITKNSNLQENMSVKGILEQDSIYSINGEFDDNGDRIRFESIINFDYFLQHVLIVFINLENIKTTDNIKIVNDMLDDKKLIYMFTNVVENGQINGQSIEKDKFSKDFINYLLKCRLLFDKYIIKREFSLNSNDGSWSIKTLKTSGQQTQKKPYYSETLFHNHNEWESTYLPRNTKNIMIQSCLRVSYISPKIMHWITTLLVCLCKSKNEFDLVNFSDVAEDVARLAVQENFISQCESNNEYRMGIDTPHIVFNYLDYLLWKENSKKYNDLLWKENSKKYNDFKFEFRNSVEHWYPQHPSDGTFESWSDVDRFGNLCIIPRNINSKFSNLSPNAKKSTFQKLIDKGSIKLRIMAEQTTSNADWINVDCEKHENEMINLLKKDLSNISN